MKPIRYRLHFLKFGGKMSDLKSILSIAQSIKNIRMTEMILPIARKSATVSTFLLGDHTSLRTALLSPQNYDREMTKCLYKHTTIIDDGQEVDMSYDDLISKISNIDKICLIWACYKATYKELGIREIICQKCKQKTKYTITLDELIQEDSITLWEEELPSFYEYFHSIVVPYENKYEYVFETSIPTIFRYNQVLGMLSIEKIRENLESNVVLSPSEELSVLINKLTIKEEGKTIASSSLLVDILTVLESAIPSEVSDELRKQYDEKFAKYVPKFYTNLSCSCGFVNKYNVDIETEFFRRTLFGRESV
jgi:hypothetical protein